MTNSIKLRNKLTGNFFANGKWDSDSKSAEVIGKGSIEHSVIRYTWDMTHVEEVSDNLEKGRDLLAKATKMRERAYTNRATNSRNAKVARLMIGRADALESKALHLMFS